MLSIPSHQPTRFMVDIESPWGRQDSLQDYVKREPGYDLAFCTAWSTIDSIKDQKIAHSAEFLSLLDKIQRCALSHLPPIRIIDRYRYYDIQGRADENHFGRDLKKKMVLLTGPRQAGKTTLAKSMAKEFSSSLYLTYDRLEDRKIILNESWRPNVELIILDEIHKMDGWKNYLKGVYDTKGELQTILVTGSARLEVFNQVGDSLAGRYFLHRLLPLSPAECEKQMVPYTIDRFLERGGFPEPFLADDPVDADRWRMQYADSLLRIDVLEFENIANIHAIRLVFELLRRKVASPISYSSIAQDVGISPNTVKHYIEVLEALYIIFRITPYSTNIARSLLKEPKIYFFDTGLVIGGEGIAFENLIALSLLKHAYAQTDYLGICHKLHYLQTKERHKVDFALTREGQISNMVEVKLTDETVGAGLRYFHHKYGFPAIQLVKNLKRERIDHGVEIVQGDTFLKGLFL